MTAPGHLRGFEGMGASASKLVVTFGEPAARDASQVGPKAAMLCQLAEAANVPAGFVVTRAAFEEFAWHNRERAWLKCAQADPTDENLRRIRAEIAATPLPGELLEQVGTGLRALHTPSVAVRSSANLEDLGSGAAAGLFRSLIGVPRNQAAIGKAVRLVWASMFNPAVCRYMEEHGRNISEVTISVIIQEVLPFYAAGVAFSVDPLNPAEGHSLIEATLGLAMPLVGGIMQPDRFTVHADGSLSQETAEKPFMFWVQDGWQDCLPGDVVQVTLRGQVYEAAFLKYTLGNVAALRPLDPLRKLTSLVESEVRDIAALLAVVRKNWGMDIDMEWGLAPSGLYALQARPVTGLDTALLPIAESACADLTSTLKGRPIAAGHVEGRVVYAGEGDPTGAILVLPDIQPRWLPSIHQAAGIIVERGGVLSHGAILCREAGKPCVQLPGVLRMRKTLRSQYVRLDATRGLLQLVPLPTEDEQPIVISGINRRPQATLASATGATSSR